MVVFTAVAEWLVTACSAITSHHVQEVIDGYVVTADNHEVYFINAIFFPV